MAEIYTTTYKSKSIFVLLNDSGNVVLPNRAIKADVGAGTYGIGKSWQKQDFEKYRLIDRNLRIEYLVTNASEMEALKAFFTTTLNGRLTAFWCPTWVSGYKVTGTQASTTALKVVKGDRTNYFDTDNGVKYRHIISWQADFSSSISVAEVETITTAGFDTLNLDASVSVDKGGIVMDLLYCRMASDSLKIAYAGGGRYRMSFNCIELQRETPT